MNDYLRPIYLQSIWETLFMALITLVIGESAAWYWESCCMPPGVVACWPTRSFTPSSTSSSTSSGRSRSLSL